MILCRCAAARMEFRLGMYGLFLLRVLRDRAAHEEVIRMVMDYASSIDFYPLALDFSPVKGPEGNIEYLLFLSKNKQDQEIVDASSIDIKAVVTASHDTLDKEPGNE